MTKVEPEPASRNARRDRLLLGVILIVAWMLRAGWSDRMAIEHFDEGVYAANSFSPHLDYCYPDQHLYAPPLLPELFESILFMTHGHPHAVLWVNVVLGTGLVAAIWWVGCLLGGPRIGLPAASFAAFSDFLIHYSRAALTDTPLTLFLTLAVGCGIVMFRSRSTWAMSGVVVFTVAAWWTKYNGWLPLAILGAGTAGSIVFDFPGWQRAFRRAMMFLVVMTLAFCGWFPYLLQLQSVGGYQAVAANHAGYIVGVSGWGDSLVRHVLTQAYFFQLGGVSLVVGWVVSHRIESPRVFDRPFIFGFVGCITIVLCAMGGAWMLLVALAGVGIWRQFHQRQVSSIAFWVMLAWLVGLFVATPMYRPYPRLLLPLWTSVLIFAAAGMQPFTGVANTAQSAHSRSNRLFHHTLVLIALIVTGRAATDLHIYENRADLQRASGDVIDAMRAEATRSQTIGGPDAVVYVLGEPGMYYHLASRSSAQPDFEFIAQPAQGLAMLHAPHPITTYIVVGPQAPQEQQVLASSPQRATLIADFEVRRSDLVLLDDMPPQELEKNRVAAFQLWKVIGH